MEQNRSIARLAWGFCLATLACVAVAISLAVLNRESIKNPDDANVLEIVLPLGFAGRQGLRGVPGEWHLYRVGEAP